MDMAGWHLRMVQTPWCQVRAIANLTLVGRNIATEAVAALHSVPGPGRRGLATKKGPYPSAQLGRGGRAGGQP